MTDRVRETDPTTPAPGNSTSIPVAIDKEADPSHDVAEKEHSGDAAEGDDALITGRSPEFERLVKPTHPETP